MRNDSKATVLGFELELQARQESAKLRQKYELDIIERQVATALINRNIRLQSSRRTAIKRLIWTFICGLSIGIVFSGLITYYAFKSPTQLDSTSHNEIVTKPVTIQPPNTPELKERIETLQLPPPPPIPILLPAEIPIKNEVSNLPIIENLFSQKDTNKLVVNTDQKQEKKNANETFSIVAIISKETILIKKNNELTAQAVNIGQMINKTEQLKQIFVDTKTIVTTTKTITLD